MNVKIETEKKAAMMATTKTLKTYVDGSVALTIYFPPESAAQAMQLFGRPDTSIAIAKLTDKAALEEMQNTLMEPKKSKSKGEYGQYASKLKTKGFCHVPEVQAIFGIKEGDEYQKEAVTWASIKIELDYESMSQVPPKELLAWAQKNQVDRYLPLVYKEV